MLTKGGRVAGINEMFGGGLAKDSDSLKPFRDAWNRTFLAAGGFDREKGNEAIRTGHSDLVVYGRHWIANPGVPHAPTPPPLVGVMCVQTFAMV